MQTSLLLPQPRLQVSQDSSNHVYQNKCVVHQLFFTHETEADNHVKIKMQWLLCKHERQHAHFVLLLSVYVILKHGNGFDDKKKRLGIFPLVEVDL